MVTKNRDIAKIATMLRAHGWIRDLKNNEKRYYEKKYKGIDKKFLFTNIGYNIRGSEIGATIGILQIKRLSKIILKRRKIGKIWETFFNKSKIFSIQKEMFNSKHSWFGIPILVNNKLKNKLPSIRKFLDERNIETRPIICGNITKQPGIKKFKYKVSGKLKNTDFIMNNSFAIGCHQNVDQKNIQYAKRKFLELEKKYE